MGGNAIFEFSTGKLGKWSKIAEFVLVIMLYFNALASQNIQTEFVDGIPWSFVIRNNEAELIGCLNSPVGYKESSREKLVIPEILASKKVTGSELVDIRRDHHGTMFEGRYHERNQKPEKPVMWRTAAYVDINAWSAGIVKKAENYEWCSFAAAVGGDEKARRGYAFMYGSADDWDVIRDCHEKSMREAMSEILAAREAERAEWEAKGEPAPSRRTDPPPSKADPGLAMPRY